MRRRLLLLIGAAAVAAALVLVFVVIKPFSHNPPKPLKLAGWSTVEVDTFQATIMYGSGQYRIAAMIPSQFNKTCISSHRCKVTVTGSGDRKIVAVTLVKPPIQMLSDPVPGAYVAKSHDLENFLWGLRWGALERERQLIHQMVQASLPTGTQATITVQYQ